MSGKLFRATAIYGIGNISQKGLSFLLVFLYTHYSTTEDIGIINSVQVFSAIYVLFLSFGLERSLYRLYHDYPDEKTKRVFLGTINIAIIIISVIVVAITVLCRNFSTMLFKEVTFYPFLVLGISDAFFTVLTIVPKLLFQVKERPYPFIFLTLGQAVLSTICIIVALATGHHSASWILASGLSAYLIFFPISIVIAAKNMTFKFDRAIFRSTLAYSLPLLPSLLSSWVINMSDRVFLEHYYSIKQVGLYSVAYKMGQVVQLFATAVLMAYTPLFYSLANQPEPDKGKLINYHNHNIRILFFLCFSIALMSNDFIKLTLTPEYLNIAYVVPIIVFGYFFIQMIGQQNLSFNQSKKTLSLMYISIISAGINMLFNYFLIKPYGIKGAAIATFLTQFIFFVITYIFSMKVYFLKIDFKKLLPMALSLILTMYLAFLFIKPGIYGLLLKMAFMLVVIGLEYRGKISHYILQRKVQV